MRKQKSAPALPPNWNQLQTQTLPRRCNPGAARMGIPSTSHLAVGPEEPGQGAWMGGAPRSWRAHNLGCNVDSRSERRSRPRAAAPPGFLWSPSPRRVSGGCGGGRVPPQEGACPLPRRVPAVPGLELKAGACARDWPEAQEGPPGGHVSPRGRAACGLAMPPPNPNHPPAASASPRKHRACASQRYCDL